MERSAGHAASMARLRLHEDDEHAILTALWRTVGAATKRPLVFSVRQLDSLAQSVGVDVAPLQLSIGHEFLLSLQLQAVHSACFSRHLGYVYVQAEAAWPLPPCSCPATPRAAWAQLRPGEPDEAQEATATPQLPPSRLFGAVRTPSQPRAIIDGGESLPPMEAFRSANSSPVAFEPAAPAAGRLASAAASHCAPVALFAAPSGPVELLAFDEMAAQPGSDEQDALEGDPLRAHAVWSLSDAPSPPPVRSTSQEDAAAPSEASSPAAVGEAAPSHGGRDVGTHACCEGAGTQVSIIRTRRLRCKQLGAELASALPCVTDMAPCFRAEAVERSDAAGGCMAVALDDAQQYVGFALGQLLAGRLGKRQLRVSVLCLADRQSATARALLAELLAQARAMLGAGERVSSLEAAVAPQPRWLTGWWERLCFHRFSSYTMQCNAEALGGHAAPGLFDNSERRVSQSALPRMVAASSEEGGRGGGGGVGSGAGSTMRASSDAAAEAGAEPGTPVHARAEGKPAANPGDNCGVCVSCLDKLEFGGRGIKRKGCLRKKKLPTKAPRRRRE